MSAYERMVEAFEARLSRLDAIWTLAAELAREHDEELFECRWGDYRPAPDAERWVDLAEALLG